jgi:hypothetical protein
MVEGSVRLLYGPERKISHWVGNSERYSFEGERREHREHSAHKPLAHRLIDS